MKKMLLLYLAVTPLALMAAVGTTTFDGQGNFQTSFTTKLQPALDYLRGNPRYEALVGKVGLP